MQKPDKRRDSSSSRLKKIWRSPKQSASSATSDSGGENSNSLRRESKNTIQLAPSGCNNSNSQKVACSLPLLQIWPSQDSPRGEADGSSFVFSVISDDTIKKHNDDTTFIESPSTSLAVNICRRASLTVEHGQDSGIESVQASPSPINAQSNQPIIVTSSSSLKQQQTSNSSPTPSDKQLQQKQRKLLHPDHARIQRPPTSPDNTSIEDMNEFSNGNLCTASSSTTSSQTSIAAIGSNHFKRLSDPWLHRQSTSSNNGGVHDDDQMESQRRRSTGRYSLLDALDLEYALLRAAARGSVGPYSLSESIHKLTFTQSLAFPALARSITSKRRRSVEHTRQRPLDPNESGLNLLAKFITACVLVLVSFLVFFIVYKFSTT
ncbi:unnamed protein product [Chironomus riparius]|uniref:Uncharacterized protein n=1 Tax=Chironomus riparius TaxID=315576 RepID=A0A9N9RVR9_9DIPT|nr:unnamed protein product [Chironomus riparius]